MINQSKNNDCSNNLLRRALQIDCKIHVLGTFLQVKVMTSKNIYSFYVVCQSASFARQVN